jgi:hypothetical protein
VPIDGVILNAQAVQFNKLLGGDETFKVSDGWLQRWKVRHGICQFNIEGNNAAAEQFSETLRKATAGSGYETALHYKLLPKKSLDFKKVPSKAGMKTNRERVTLFLCAN